MFISPTVNNYLDEYMAHVILVILFPALSRQEEGAEGRDGTYVAREFATHIIGEVIGEVFGESMDEAVERVVGDLLGVEVEESEDPLIIGGLGRGLGRALGK